MEPRRVGRMLGGRAVLGQTVTSMSDLERAVERGLPKAALTTVAQRLFPDPAMRRAAIHRIVPEATFKRRRAHLSLVESERTERLARVAALAEEVLGGLEEAREFLSASHPMLDGRTPAEAATTDLGARQVERILQNVAHGLPA
jgi:putative toxin-antitoxin system antitoxin component (TIGR02293 family)